MQALTVIVFQTDPRLAQALSATLSLHYHSVHVALSLDELCIDLARYRADVAVLFIEASNFGAIEPLHREFPRGSILLTQPVADEEIWGAALYPGGRAMWSAFATQ